MSSEIKWAFGHPSERAEGTASQEMLDRISLRDHVVTVEIGAFQAERGTTQRICFNVVVEVEPQDRLDDDVDRILSYDKVTEAIAHELGAERLNLLETLAQRVADRILLEPQARRVFVRIEKLDRGPGALGVEIMRARSTTSPASAPPQRHGDDRPHPEVIYLSNAAIASPHLKGWIDQLSSGHRPTILCVGAPDLPAPAAGHPMAQRRIDLLAIEQNAWVLAARDPRCVVVNSRTELDWSMRQGQISVWAPSKIVLDAVDGPSAQPRDALALVLWFARHMQAADVVVIGETPPKDADLPIRALGADQPDL
ncbi:dihydroneopterin aldolase [Seohaeicola saemankumensis]|uniref:dihydroneopterin aldolase n=1 Tax=Seohaeicola saemankumensis TaxID=481181 RepID=A0ABW3TA85_9RHOB